MAKLRLPDDTERHVIVGTTGSGKTIFGLHCLSRRSYDRIPWIIVDFKGDDAIARIPDLREIGIGDAIPKRAGLYVVRPLPEDVDSGAVKDFFFRVWKKERTGLFLDEGYMVPRFDTGLRTLLTQGRSKRTPLITLTQKPVWCSPQLFSESEFKSVFYLDVAGDIAKIGDIMPAVDPRDLPRHWSYWYQRGERLLVRMKPCPPLPRILETFEARIPKRRWWI